MLTGGDPATLPMIQTAAMAGLAAVAAGAINALAGGGTLITFPTLLALGLPAVSANVTNTVALLPGYLGGILAQRGDLRGQSARLWKVVPAGLAGGALGGILLLWTEERLFRALVPLLILLACALLALQDPVRAWLQRRGAARGSAGTPGGTWAAPPTGLACVYGGYFGAGLGVMVLAVLGLTVDDTLTRLNALKQTISFAANLAAAILFVFSSRVVWPVALLMAIGALAGGAFGGMLARRVSPRGLRWLVVAIGIVVAVAYEVG